MFRLISYLIYCLFAKHRMTEQALAELEDLE